MDRGVIANRANPVREERRGRHCVASLDPPGGPRLLVHEQFERLAAARPETPALVQGSQEEWSYGALNARANQLAWTMLRRGVGKGDCVAILTQRSMGSIASLLAVMKVGAAYVPLDLSLPPRRILSIIDDSGCAVVLTDTAGRRLLAEANLGLNVDLLEIEKEGECKSDLGNPGTVVDGGDVVYCMYTSGSTGSPKGVLVCHEGLRNYVEWATKTYVNESIRSFALISSLSFDLTVTSIFVPLVSGRLIHIYPQVTGEDLPVLKAITENAVDILKLTPSHLALLAGREFQNTRLKTVIVGGEDLKADVAKRAHQAFSGRVAIYNEYGPTETVVGCLLHRFDPEKDLAGSVPIGRPIDNVRVYVLDGYGSELPHGVVGCLHIAGVGVALGYKNHPELTAAQFMPDARRTGDRMYASGDLARYNHSGELVYVGRIDDQVKIRGHRVELAEIERHLIAHPDISECVVEMFRRPAAPAGGALLYCSRCGLASNYPNTSYDQDNVCNHCRAFIEHRAILEAHFRSIDDLRRLIAKMRLDRRSAFDCLVLLSGGKDSTYALGKMVELGAHVLAVTLDPGYLSAGAKENIERTVSRLGIEHRYLTTPAMKEIFVDSLERHSNVCNGCFKALYTLSANLALDLGVDYIVTGLSRGQLLETRLTAFSSCKAYDEAQVDRSILESRKIYHRIDDAVTKLLDTRRLQGDDVLDKINFVDFYRYVDVSADEIYRYIAATAGWIRPSDTGRSTNCLINSTGIFIHNKERGYHNYALPYSWDVRLGHKTRAQAMQELSDLQEIDLTEVSRILKEIGYPIDPAATQESDSRLIAYYVAKEELLPDELRRFLLRELPDYMAPACFIRLDSLPLSSNGKIDRGALPRPEAQERRSSRAYIPPATETERTLVSLWREALDVEHVGVQDNFFDLGGSSLSAALLLFRVAETFGKVIPIDKFIQAPTVARLAGCVA